MSRAQARVAVVLTVVASLLAAVLLLACIGDPPVAPLVAGDAGRDAFVADVVPDTPLSADSPAETSMDGPILDAGSDGALVRFPTHTSSTYLQPDAGPLPPGVSVIDTQNLVLEIDGGTFLPPGVTFALDGNQNAVLSIGSWTMDSDVTVIGTARLIVVASGPVTLDAVLHGEAVGPDGGPGSIPAGTPNTPGAGGNGFNNGSGPSSGGGAGFGTPGGSGAGQQPISAGGQTFGANLLDFSGGCAGGTGNLTQTNPSKGYGGGGGGAIQISSAVSITIGASGGINVGGGGGLGGVANQPGAGGGSGGLIFLEAPSVTVSGLLAANGGGGGTGDDQGQGDSFPGSDGQLGVAPAPGGSSTNPVESPGGSGAAGAVGPDGGPGLVQAGNGSNTDSNTSAPSGGGGGVGRIWFRSRGAPGPIDETKVSPPAAVDETL